jgi:hypothetical protein
MGYFKGVTEAFSWIKTLASLKDLQSNIDEDQREALSPQKVSNNGESYFLHGLTQDQTFQGDQYVKLVLRPVNKSSNSTFNVIMKEKDFAGAQVSRGWVKFEKSGVSVKMEKSNEMDLQKINIASGGREIGLHGDIDPVSYLLTSHFSGNYDAPVYASLKTQDVNVAQRGLELNNPNAQNSFSSSFRF